MKHVFLFVLLLCIPVALTANPGTAGNPDWVKRSNENAQILLNTLAKYSPEGAGQLGVDGLDEEVVDLRPGLNARLKSDMLTVIKQLETKLPAEQDQSVKQDIQILIKSAKDNIRGIELGEKYQIPYFDISQTVFQGLRGLLDDQIPVERRKAALVRLRKYAGMDANTQPITKLAIDRTKEQLSRKGLLGPVKAEIDKGMANAQFYIDGIKQLFDKYQLTGYEQAYEKLKTQLADYKAFVQKELVPIAREDFRLPTELYAYSLEQFGVEMEPNALATMAREGFANIQKQMQELAPQVAKQRGWNFTDYRDVIRELKKEQLVGDAILPFYEKRIKDIERIIKSEHLVSLPQRDVRMRIASPAEAAQTPAPNMRPPRLLGNTGEMGEFVLPLNVPAPPGEEGKTQKMDDFTFEAGSWSLTAHEARPGHEMQFAAMIEKGVSTARGIFSFNSANVEGWGLYSEEIMRPYFPADGKLVSLQFLLQRAARAFLDPELQLGKITKEEAFRVLREDVCLSEAMANQEVERYTFRAPGQATSYYYGYRKLMDLRKEVENKLGDKFDKQKFHDFILSQGLIPPPMLREAAIKEFDLASK